MEFQEVVRGAGTKTGGRDGFLNTPSILDDATEKSGKRTLCDMLIELTKAGTISWVRSCDNTTMVCRRENVTFILRETEGGYTGYTNDESKSYSLRAFDERQELFSNADAYSWVRYDSDSARKPIMDLWDILTKGGQREVVPAHWCNRTGYGAPGDTCPGCEYAEAKRA